MARLLVQSLDSFQFLHSHPVTGDVKWTGSLVAAIRFGVCDDMEQAAQLIEDHCDPGCAVVVDLDMDTE